VDWLSHIAKSKPSPWIANSDAIVLNGAGIGGTGALRVTTGSATQPGNIVLFAASKAVVDLLINRARSLIYATGLPPPVIAASIAGLDIIAGDPALCAVPLKRAQLFAAQLNLATPQSPIVPLIVGASDAALAASQALETAGFLVTAIRPPTVPDGTARLRVTFTAAHSEDDVLRLAAAVRAVVPPVR
jgi:8-amino-7-oxononanoate synthase